MGKKKKVGFVQLILTVTAIQTVAVQYINALFTYYHSRRKLMPCQTLACHCQYFFTLRTQSLPSPKEANLYKHVQKTLQGKTGKYIKLAIFLRPTKINGSQKNSVKNKTVATLQLFQERDQHFFIFVKCNYLPEQTMAYACFSLAALSEANQLSLVSTWNKET